ncbi:MAG: family 78 glycoside hydrolase catalytic domain [Cyclobacteriaceae bacterium]|nr:family 78 glycoside hydrolase catalytic domain [Cyclobacteriaceae bacterium]
MPKHFIWLFLILLNQHLFAGIHPVRLTCEYLFDPPVVDVKQPRLAWVNIADEGERGQQQTAWQIRVASAKALLETPDLWDGRKVNGAESNRIAYAGVELHSRQECWWQVRVWDRDGKVSEWSEPAFWRMGLLKENDWQAKWIGAPWQGEEALPKPPGGPAARPAEMPPPAPLLRKNFSVIKEVSKAVVYTTGLGYFELYLNGQKIGEDVLVPNNTNYGKRPYLINEPIPLPDDFTEYRVMYLAYDVKENLTNEDNAIGAILGNGFYNPAKFWAGAYGSPRFIAQLHIQYADGTEQVIVSDESWKASKSAIIMDMLYYGEYYDARLEQEGWSTPGFNAQAWEPVHLRKAPEGKMVAHTAMPDRVTERLPVKSIKKLGDGHFFADFGVEISGWLRIQNVNAPAGHKIEFKYNSNEYSGDNYYICKGGSPETYAARFNWFVFSGVEIINWPGELRPEQLTAEMVNTWVEETSEFETSNPLFNDIQRIWKRSQVDNMHGGIASDCPHRERTGYTGDGQVACVTVMHNYDARSFYHKWIQDIKGAQIVSTGYVPNGAPWQPGCGGGVAWGAAISIMPWEFYLHYGATDILENTFESMKGYIRYMKTWVDADGIMHSQATGRDGKPLKWLNLGDWVPPGELVPDDLVHTFYFWRCASLTAETAKVLGLTQEYQTYMQLAEDTRRAFHKRFFDPVNGTYGIGGADIFALKMGVPENEYPRVLASLQKNIQANKGHLDTGIFGTQFFFEMLAEHGMQHLAYEAMNKTTMPSFGHWLTLGATTTRESWDSSNSHNHPMFGGGIVWFYRKLAGMQADQEAPGYRHIIFKPQPVGELDFVNFSNLTPFGKAGIRWENPEKGFIMNVSVPVGSSATVHVPLSKGKKVSETGGSKKNVRLISKEKDQWIYKVQSGNYRFEVK